MCMRDRCVYIYASIIALLQNTQRMYILLPLYHVLLLPTLYIHNATTYTSIDRPNEKKRNNKRT